jgi:hypothetical protein
MSRHALEEFLGAPPMPGGDLTDRLHWDGPRSFWNVDIVEGFIVKDFVIVAPNGHTYKIDEHGVSDLGP